jgi:hypothetical protein
VHRRSGEAKQPAVPPDQPSGRQSPSHRLSASAHKDRTWPATKQFLRRDSGPAPSALCHLRANCSLGSMSPQGLVIVQHCDCVALKATVLSGYPTGTSSFFSQCPVSGPSPFAMARHRRARHTPLARDDIPHISRVTRSATPPGPDVIPMLGC